MTLRPLLHILTAPLAGLLLLLCGCQRKQPVPDLPRLVTGVALQDVGFHSAALGRDMTYRVFLPAIVGADQKLPVVYLLHGNGGNYRDWSNDSNVSEYVTQGMILVMPEGSASYFMNAVEKSRDKYEDYLLRDLIADVEARFPARTDREGRSIIGVSMGGFAAIELGLSHPDMFTFVGAISPAIDVAERRFSWRRVGQWWQFRTIFGPFGSEERQARDPFVLLRSVNLRNAPFIYLTIGQKEPLLEPNQRFAARLKRSGLAYKFHTMPGGHDWTQWDAQIPGTFESLLRRLSGASGHSIH